MTRSAARVPVPLSLLLVLAAPLLAQTSSKDATSPTRDANAALLHERLS